jgi:hypothetical protein
MPDKVNITYGDVGGKTGIKEFAFDTNLWGYKIDGKMLRVFKKGV